MPQKYNLTQGMGVGNNQHPFSVSTNSEKVDDSQKTAQDILRETFDKQPDINELSGLGTIIGDRPLPDLKLTVKEAEKYYKYGVTPNPYVDQDVLDKARAKNQGIIEKTTNMVGQAVINEILIGTVKGFFDIFDAAKNIGSAENNDYVNAVSGELEKWQDGVRNWLEIYQKDSSPGFHINDYGWWMNGAVNAATTVSLMIPGLAISKGVSALGKIGKIGSNLGKLTRQGLRAAKIMNTGRVYHTIKNATSIASMAFLSRTAENYQEARETYKLVLDDTKNKLSNFTPQQREEFFKHNPQFKDLSDDEIAENIASASANQTFKQDYWMLLMDIPQFKSLSAIYKGAGIASKATTRAVRNASRKEVEKLIAKGVAKEEAEKVANTFGKRILNNFKFENIGTNLKNLWNSTEGLMLSEGIEEGFQGIQSQRGEEYGELYFNPYLQRKGLGDYLRDESIWEQAFWGVAGGLLFQGAAKGFNKLENRIRAKIEKGDLSKEQIELLKAGEDAGRVANINSWFKSMQEYRDDMEKISRGINIYSPKTNEKGEVILDSNKNVIYNEVTSAEEIERLKTIRTDEYLTKFTIDAINNGNFDLLKEFVSNKEFNEYFKEQGIDIDEALEGQFIDKMQEVYDEYEKAYYNIIDNTDAYNDHITRLAATDLVYKRVDLKEARKRVDDLNAFIDSEELSNKDYYEQLTKQQVINAKLNEIDNAINRVNQNYENYDIYSKQAYNDAIKNLNEQKSFLYGLLEKVNPDFKYSEIKSLGKDKFDYDTILAEASKKYNEIIKNNNLLDTTPIDKLSNTVKESLYQKAAYEVFADELENDLPHTNNAKDYYKNLYNEKEAQFIDIATSKFSDAFKTVQSYVKKSENVKEAVNRLLKDKLEEDKTLSNREIGRLNSALELLRFGSENRVAFTAALAELIDAETNKRNKTQEKQSEDFVDDKKVKTEINDAAEAKNEEKEKTKATVIKDDDTVPFTKDEVPKPTLDEEAIAKAQDDAYRRREIYENKDSMALRIADEATNKIKFQNGDLWKNVVDEGVTSSSYNDFVNRVVDEMIAQGVTPAIAEQNAQQGIRLHLDNIVNKVSKIKNLRGIGNVQGINAEEKLNKIKNLLSSIEKTLGFNEDGSSMYEGVEEKEALSKENKNIEEVFINFVDSYGLGEKKDGKIEIDIADVFSKLIRLFDDNNRSYESLLYLYKDIARYVEQESQNSKFKFNNKKDLQIGFYNFVQALYAAKTKTVVESPFMHFASSLQSENNTTAFGLSEDNKFKLVQSARDKEVSISYSKDSRGVNRSIKFEFDGIEMGYIALVKANKDNTVLTAQYVGQIIDIKKNKKSFTSKALSIYDKILKDDSLYNILAEQFYKNNLNLFTSASIENKIKYSKEYNQEERDKILKEFFNNEIIKEFIANNPSLYGSAKQNWSLFEKINEAINGILFYDLKRNDVFVSGDDRINILNKKKGLKASLNTFKAKVYDNFSKTKNLQDKLDTLERQAKTDNSISPQITAILRGDSQGKIKYEDGQAKQVKSLGLTTKISNNPQDNLVIYYDGLKGISENGTVYTNIPGLGSRGNSVGTMGLILGVNQGKNIVREDGTIDNVPGANIALFNGNNLVNSTTSSEAGKLQKATIKYVRGLFEEYYYKIKDNTLSYNQKSKAFDDLYENLNALFGNTETKLFSNFIVSKRKDNVIHLAWQIAPGEFENIITLFKYDNVKYINGKPYDITTGRIIEDEKLVSNMKGGMEINLGKSNRYIMYNISSEKAQNVLNTALDFIGEHMTFNKSRFAINAGKSKQGKHIYINNGRFNIEVGDFKRSYNSYAEAVVKLNMFVTTQIGGVNSRYEYDGTLPRSFYLEIKEKVTPVSEQEKALAGGFESYVNNNKIKPGQAVKTEDVLKGAGINETIIGKVIDFNEALKEEGAKALLSENVIVGGIPVNKKGELVENAHAYWNGINVMISDLGITKSRNNPPLYILRLVIHENIHRLIEEQRFFDGELGKSRVVEINKIYQLFKERLDKQNTSLLRNENDVRIVEGLREKFSKFNNDYAIKGDNSTNYSLASEFMAEVMSDISLRSYLASIQTKVTINNKEENRTLLQRILDFLCELFGISTSNKDLENTLLGRFYNVLDNVTAVTQEDTSIIDSNEKDGTKISPQTEPVKVTVETETPVEKFEKETDDEGYPNGENSGYNALDGAEYVDVSSSYDEISAKELVFENIDSNPTYDIFNVSKAPDMETYLQTIPSKYKAVIADSMENNELEYLCK